MPDQHSTWDDETKQVSLAVSNKTGVGIQVYWIDYDCGRVLYASVEQGGSWTTGMFTRGYSHHGSVFTQSDM